MTSPRRVIRGCRRLAYSEPVHIVPRPSSPALCQSNAKDYLLQDYYSGATGTPGGFSKRLLLRRLQLFRWRQQLCGPLPPALTFSPVTVAAAPGPTPALPSPVLSDECSEKRSPALLPVPVPLCRAQCSAARALAMWAITFGHAGFLEKWLRTNLTRSARSLAESDPRNAGMERLTEFRGGSMP